MPAWVARFLPQPAISLLVSLLAGLALAGAWLTSGLQRISAGDVLVAVMLICSVAAGYRFPIHVGRAHKVEMITVSLYLMAVFLPSPALGATSALIAILAGEMLVRRERGNYYSDVLTAAGRWAVVVLAGATYYQVFGTYAHSPVMTAVILWTLDLLTEPIVIAPMTGERPLQFLLSNIRTAVLVEGAQYLLGILGALAASVQVWALGLLLPPTILVYVALKSVKEVHSSTRLILESMADTVDLRDPYTGGHSQRVAEMSGKILKTMGLSGPEVQLIVAAARVHDIGKIGVPDSILNKPERLTPEEEAVMQTHPDRGADLLQRYPDFKRGVDIVRHHHENWDGSGYPQGMKGNHIPFGARVIAVADSYDAMASDRPYRKAMPEAKAARILLEGCGKQWDPQIVAAFIQAMGFEPELASAPAAAKIRLRTRPRRVVHAIQAR